MIKKRLVIDLDVITGDVKYENVDEMTYSEFLLTLESVKMELMVDYWKRKME